MGWSEIQKPQDNLPLYPDIEKHGSLANLLNALFQEMGSPLRCEDSPLFKQAGGYIKYGERYSQLSIAAKMRSFHFDLWQQGICLTSSWSENPQDMALVLHRLLVLNQSPLDVEAEVSWFNLDVKARAFLEWPKAYKDNQWRQLDELMREDTYLQQLHPVLVAARAHPQLGLLYPFTSLVRFSSAAAPAIHSIAHAQVSGRHPKLLPTPIKFKAGAPAIELPNLKAQSNRSLPSSPPNFPPTAAPPAKEQQTIYNPLTTNRLY